jgi:hypothetical protein
VIALKFTRQAEFCRYSMQCISDMVAQNLNPKVGLAPS